MKKLAEQIRQELLCLATPQTQEVTKRFFKEPIKCYGIKSPDIKKISKQVLKLIKDSPKQKVFDLCNELWKSGFLEENGIACALLYAQKIKYEPQDFIVFEQCLEQYTSNWAACDVLCNHSLGSFIVMYPEFLKKLKEWTGSQNRWKQRAAAVSLIIPARQGLFLQEVFDITNLLIGSNDDLVQKGYGWMLKAASEAHQQEVFTYLLDKKDIMPRTAFRYALEKMPKELRAKAMQN